MAEFYRKSCRVDKHNNTLCSYVPLASTSNTVTEPKLCCSKLHKVKCFADNLTIISSLTSLVPKAGDICLEFQPAKCVTITLCFALKKLSMTSYQEYYQHLWYHLYKIPGKINSVPAAHNMASDILRQQISLYLQCIDSGSIRGEYKVLILKNFVTSVLHFHISVERGLQGQPSNQPNCLCMLNIAD